VIADFDGSLRIHPCSVVFDVRGVAYSKLGQHQRAIRDFDEAIRRGSWNAQALNNRGTAYRGLGQQQRAVEDYDESIRLDPWNGEAYANRAQAHAFLGQDGESQQDLERAVGLGIDRAELESFVEKAKKQGRDE
jgi:tetratricopeptide (TPR) repeat protein